MFRSAPADRPFVGTGKRATATRLDDNFEVVMLRYGFMEAADVPADLGLAGKGDRKGLDPMRTSYFVGRNSLKPDAKKGMPLWQDRLFMFLQRNASDPTEFRRLPPGKVLEPGEQVTV